MCLAIPGNILSIIDDNPLTRCGFAISTLDEEEANRVFDYLDEIAELPDEKGSA